MKPASALQTDAFSAKPSETTSLPPHQQGIESVFLDVGEALIPITDGMPFGYIPNLWNNQPIDNDQAVVNIDDLSPTAPSTDGEVPTKVTRVHRSRVRDDMLEIFSDPSIFQSSLNAIIINQHGHEEAGQGSRGLREVFSLFWKECYEPYMLGETERVPYIRHVFDRKKWEAVGRILVKGHIESQYFPIR